MIFAIMEELYIDILGYEGLYQVSNIGNIKSLSKWSKGEILKHSISKDKRKKVNLYKDKAKKTWLVHRLVLISFKGYSDNPEQNQVNHIDGNPSNNNIDNLEWSTAKENTKHYFDFLYKPSSERKTRKPRGKYKPRKKIIKNKIIKEGKTKEVKVKKEIKPHHNNVSIDQFDLDGNYLQTFESAMQAERIMNDWTKSYGIYNCIHGKTKTHRGYIYKLTSDR